MKNPVCEHCKYRHPECATFFTRIICPIYRGAQFRKRERWRERVFGEDYTAEDRYDTILMIVASIIVLIIIIMLFSTINQIDIWIHGE